MAELMWLIVYEKVNLKEPFVFLKQEVNPCICFQSSVISEHIILVTSTPKLHGCCDMTDHAKRSKDTLYPIMFSNVQNGQDASYLSLHIRNLAADFIAGAHA